MTNKAKVLCWEGRAKSLRLGESGFHKPENVAANDSAPVGDREALRAAQMLKAEQAYKVLCQAAFDEAMTVLADDPAYSNRAVAGRMRIDEGTVRDMRRRERPCDPKRVMCGGERLVVEFFRALAKGAAESK